MNAFRCLGMAILVLMLEGCRVELYNGLSQSDANQMLAILMNNNIDADKQPSPDGGVTLRVEQSQFIDAVELLRMDGFPRQRYTTVETMFPPNQLVVSPREEQQKILYLTEQHIEEMLSQMDGVIHASVAIATHHPSDDVETRSGDTTSVAVFIKYYPRVNLEEFILQINSMIEKAMPGVQYDQISILMQPAGYRARVAPPPKSVEERAILKWLSRYRQYVTLTLILLASALLILAVWKGWQQIRPAGRMR
ncbi:MAG: EscJ/YscJ/HrcJ family type III secretion inner membrane ring protein SsaJ [Symbiopectobacterium sp.]|uniref:EscJ/YscJ/HrcJ family type III secretion inner membrane ring protein SsaJ n=1 Tax=Symbiopectobacterium sp. TaxID=2952789 RepID=UPI0039E9CEAB